ncbi:MAG: FAD:protein FMN transferase [Pedosphaera sp.]|nr:FAD:protein FMN transferase [Pedosphaera sp.]
MAVTVELPLLMACHAMATRFELVLYGGNPIRMRAIAEEAFEEIQRLDRQLSAYRDASDISRINSRSSMEWVRVEPRLFALLDRARQISEATTGAFDITAGPLSKCWGFAGGNTSVPSSESITAARQAVGFQKLVLDSERSAVRFLHPGMRLDLGAIGKGYALDCAVTILREAGVEAALIHGGTSTSCAIGAPPGAPSWVVALPPAVCESGGAENPEPSPRCIALRNESLSVSAVWGRSFREGNRELGHVMDPRTGEPTQSARSTAVVLPSATESDALSTALLVLGPAGVEPLLVFRPNARIWIDEHPWNVSVSEKHGGSAVANPPY